MMEITRCRLAKMYKNFSGRSNVAAYETGVDYIKVEMRCGKIVKFNFRTAGIFTVHKMKKLAVSGAGLGDYIRRHCRL